MVSLCEDDSESPDSLKPIYYCLKITGVSLMSIGTHTQTQPKRYLVAVLSLLANSMRNGSWIGRGGVISWPPRSPDLTPLDYYLWCWIKSWGQLSDNTPPVMYLDRNWVVQDTDPVGEVIARVKAEDPDREPLTYGLELKGFNGPGDSKDKPLPFVINTTTGVVKINESLVGRDKRRSKFELGQNIREGDGQSVQPAVVVDDNKIVDQDSAERRSESVSVSARSEMGKSEEKMAEVGEVNVSGPVMIEDIASRLGNTFEKLSRKISEKIEGGEQLFFYVTVFDGKFTSKTEVWARIRNSSADPNSTELNNEGPPPPGFLPNFPSQYPGAGGGGNGRIPPPFIQPPSSLPGFTRKPRPPPPPPPPPLSPEQTTLITEGKDTAQEPTKAAETAETPTVKVPTPSPTTTTSAHYNVTPTTPAEGTVTSVPDLAATVIPISLVCGLFVIGGIAAWLFRKKLCRYRNKANKDDMHKEPSGGIVLEEPMALQHWRGPRAHSNRYEGWDRDSNQQVSFYNVDTYVDRITVCWQDCCTDCVCSGNLDGGHDGGGNGGGGGAGDSVASSVGLIQSDGDDRYDDTDDTFHVCGRDDASNGNDCVVFDGLGDDVGIDFDSGDGDTGQGNLKAPAPGGTKPDDRWEFPRHRLKVFNILGEGCFGQVWRCEALDIDGREGTTVVAVKTLKENASDKERSDLVQELQVMKMLEPHPNVKRAKTAQPLAFTEGQQKRVGGTRMRCRQMDDSICAKI
ncbi:hypothetical protein ANN_12959 [Periplaneta americana]|uniref:Protein kinase domain-containing protein n=1 Tax=Periplaneta americana TaxID=6978 RepID=A0ABQ8TKR6_PERAM|nr:hypothetical protein ANN_12959 [Periplaneta americana]